jgi:hypothetical protein
LFYLEPEWLNDVKEFLKTRQIEGYVIDVTKIEIGWES